MPILDNPRMEKFCQLAADPQTTRLGQAYMDAGYRVKSIEVADAHASRMGRVGKVEARIAELKARIAARTLAATELTTTSIVRRLASIASGDLRRVMKWDKKGIYVVASKDLTDEQAGMISEVKKLPDGTVVVKLHNPTPALRLLGEHMGMFSGEDASGVTANVQVTQNNGPVTYINAPRRETVDEWKQRTARERSGAAIQPGRPAK